MWKKWNTSSQYCIVHVQLSTSNFFSIHLPQNQPCKSPMPTELLKWRVIEKTSQMYTHTHRESDWKVCVITLLQFLIAYDLNWNRAIFIWNVDPNSKFIHHTQYNWLNEERLETKWNLWILNRIRISEYRMSVEKKADDLFRVLWHLSIAIYLCVSACSAVVLIGIIWRGCTCVCVRLQSVNHMLTHTLRFVVSFGFFFQFL